MYSRGTDLARIMSDAQNCKKIVFRLRYQIKALIKLSVIN